MSRSQSAERRYTSARERAEKQSTGFGGPYLKLPEGVQLFKPKAGVMVLDILPFVAGEGNPWAEPGNLHWERTYYGHRGVGANNDTYLCPRMTSKSRCPICEYRLVAMKKAEGDPDLEQVVKDLAPKQRQLFNVINLKEPDKGIQLWDFSYHLFGKVLDARIRNSEVEDGWDEFHHLDTGMSLKIGFIERTFGGHAFCEVETIDFKPRREAYGDEVLEQVYCLDDMLIEPSYDELKKVFLQTGSTDDAADDDADPAPPARRAAPAAPAARRQAAPPADDDVDPAPPARRAAPAAPAARRQAPPADADDGFDDPPRVRTAQEEMVDDADPPPPARRAAPAAPAARRPAAPASKPAAADDGWDDFDPPAKPARGANRA